MRVALALIVLITTTPGWAGPPTPPHNPYSAPQTERSIHPQATGLHEQAWWPKLLDLSQNFRAVAKQPITKENVSGYKDRLSESARTTADAAREILREEYPSDQNALFRDCLGLTPPWALAELDRIVRSTLIERADVPTLMAYTTRYQSTLGTQLDLHNVHRDILVGAFALGTELYLRNRFSLGKVAPNTWMLAAGLFTGGSLALALTETDLGLAFLQAYPRVAVGLIAIAYSAPTVIRATLNTIFGRQRAEQGLRAMELGLGSPALSVLDYRLLATQSEAARRLARSWNPRCQQILKTLSDQSRWDAQD